RGEQHALHQRDNGHDDVLPVVVGCRPDLARGGHEHVNVARQTALALPVARGLVRRVTAEDPPTVARQYAPRTVLKANLVRQLGLHGSGVVSMSSSTSEF